MLLSAHIDNWIKNKGTVYQEDFLDYYTHYLLNIHDYVSDFETELNTLKKQKLMILNRIYEVYKDTGGLENK